ncbi:hypothetical protein SAMN06265795_12656 [Noviherbaspirillum humi]|uniref:Uncharacterized protein n=1 Tax=Noviherbaspirillum humi TaxID=1688639 RepID=A0A239LVZ3_9BURK|nr:hypothetical protein [Noviherbaspirillum humi]SNT33879.1 hypothetical protein SAMN06265795_12656 [Noviherbaspirillum humi]
MPDKLKETIMLPVAIPAWGLLCIIAGAIYTAGQISQKLDTLIENYSRTELKVAAIHERQIGGLAAIATLQQQAQSHETRLASLERAAAANERVVRR